MPISESNEWPDQAISRMVRTCQPGSVRKSIDMNFIIAIFPTIITGAQARNPIGPPLTFPADPSAKVGADGRLYVYCSLDEKTDHYCSYSNVVLSTDDMKTWSKLFISFS